MLKAGLLRDARVRGAVARARRRDAADVRARRDAAGPARRPPRGAASLGRRPPRGGSRGRASGREAGAGPGERGAPGRACAPSRRTSASSSPTAGSCRPRSSSAAPRLRQRPRLAPAAPPRRLAGPGGAARGRRRDGRRDDADRRGARRRPALSRAARRDRAGARTPGRSRTRLAREGAELLVETLAGLERGALERGSAERGADLLPAAPARGRRGRLDAPAGGHRAAAARLHAVAGPLHVSGRRADQDPRGRRRGAAPRGAAPGELRRARRARGRRRRRRHGAGAAAGPAGGEEARLRRGVPARASRSCPARLGRRLRSWRLRGKRERLGARTARSRSCARSSSAAARATPLLAARERGLVAARTATCCASSSSACCAGRRRSTRRSPASSRVPLEKLAPRLREILEVALYQIRHLDRVPDYAAVSEAVDAGAGERRRGRGAARQRRPPRDPAPAAAGPLTPTLSAADGGERRRLAPARLLAPPVPRRALARAFRAGADAARSSRPTTPLAARPHGEPAAPGSRRARAGLSPPRASRRGRRRSRRSASRSSAETRSLAAPSRTAPSCVQDVGSQALPLLLPPGDTLVDLRRGAGRQILRGAPLGRARRSLALDRRSPRLRPPRGEPARGSGFRRSCPSPRDVAAPPLPAGRFDRVLLDAPAAAPGRSARTRRSATA